MVTYQLRAPAPEIVRPKARWVALAALAPVLAVGAAAFVMQVYGLLTVGIPAG